MRDTYWVLWHEKKEETFTSEAKAEEFALRQILDRDSLNVRVAKVENDVWSEYSVELT